MKRMLMQFMFGSPASATRTGDIGLLLLRLIGLMMAIGHGKSKLFGPHGFGPPQQLVEGVVGMGFPPFFAWLAASAEFLGGLFLAIGLLTRPAALALAFNMAVAALMAHRADPMFMTGAGPAKEPALLYLLPFAALMLTGAGRFSIDRLILGKVRSS
jgi:putative oxidoreductase